MAAFALPVWIFLVKAPLRDFAHEPLIVAFAILAYTVIDSQIIRWDIQGEREVVTFGVTVIIIVVFFVSPTGVIAVCLGGMLLSCVRSGFAIQNWLYGLASNAFLGALLCAVVTRFANPIDPHSMSHIVIVMIWGVVLVFPSNFFLLLLKKFEAKLSFAELMQAKKNSAPLYRFVLLGAVLESFIDPIPIILLGVSPWTLIVIMPVVAMVFAALKRFGRPQRQARIFQILFDLTQQLQGKSNRDTSIELLLTTLIVQCNQSYAELLFDDADGVHSVYMTAGNRVPTTRLINSADQLSTVLQMLETSTMFQAGDNLEALASRFDEHELLVAFGATLPSTIGRRGVLLVGSTSNNPHGVFVASQANELGIFANAAASALHLDDLATSIERLDAQHEHVWHQATHDPLTGIANRRLFTERLQHALNRRKPELAVLYIDLDNLKQVNDQLGHTTGDQLIINAARHFETYTREYDTIARLGGDEFAIIFENISQSDAQNLSQRLVNTFHTTYQTPDGTTIHATASAGLAYANPGTTIDQLLTEADQNLYTSKRNDKGQLTVSL